MRLLAGVLAAALAADALAAEPAAEPKVTGALSASYYALPHEPDFTVGVGAINWNALRLEARYNYEAPDTGSLFAGWKFKGGGEELSWEVTPIIGTLVGQGGTVIPGAEISVAYKSFDIYTEAEYVADRNNHDENYFYAWSELGWRPVSWLRVGIVGQRTRIVHTDRDLQRGLFAQVTAGPLTVGAYAFNPDAGSRYTVISAAFAF
jgi:hypothetical protein